jgi:hypothetical protein
MLNASKPSINEGLHRTRLWNHYRVSAQQFRRLLCTGA